MKLKEQTYDLSIIIVNYNSGSFLANCINSILENVLIKYEVIIVDNCSTDSSIEQAENSYKRDFINIIKSNENIGFARANNLGSRYAKGRILHFLNPDTLLTQEINLDYCQILSENKDFIYVNDLVNMDKSSEPSKNLVPFLSNYLNWIFFRSKAIYWYTGATVIMSKNVFKVIGGWPEDYFIYSEDMDLFYIAYLNRIGTIELKNSIIHIGKGCTSSIWSKLERERKVQNSFKIFFLKYNKKYEYPLIKMIIFLYGFLKKIMMKVERLVMLFVFL